MAALVSLANSSPSSLLDICTTSAHSLRDNDLPQCGNGTAYYERINRTTKQRESKVVHLSCGKRTCLRCQKRRRSKLRWRLRQIRWRGSVQMWTITTDPKILSPQEALRTLHKRWHLVARGLLRLRPDIRWFKCLELTESGLPHLHLITDKFIDWHAFQSLLVKAHFGEVLHFTRADEHRAIIYCTKYVSKLPFTSEQPQDWPVRTWSATNHLLPVFAFVDPDGQWLLVYVDLPWLQNSRRYSMIPPANPPPSYDGLKR